MDLAAEVVMNRVSESYVKLVLAVGHHDPDYVDACYGPVEWQEELEAVPMPLITVRGVALQRIEELDRDGRPVEDELLELRFQYLTKQLESLVARTRMLEGDRTSFPLIAPSIAVTAAFPLGVKDVFNRALEQVRDPEGEGQAGMVFPSLQRVHRLSGNPQ